MNERDVDELQDEAQWDFERAETHPPARTGRAVVSVAFSREDFDRVAAAARAENKKLSEFIRSATLERISRKSNVSGPYQMSSSGSGLLHGSYTRATAVHVEWSHVETECSHPQHVDE